MEIKYKTRDFYHDELRVLKTLKTQKEKENTSKIRFYHFLNSALIGGTSAYITSIIPDSFWTFLLGTIAVFAFAFIVFAPYEIYKQKKLHKLFLRQLSETIDRGTVNTCEISAKRIAIAPEYEDETDLYVVELYDNEVLHLWDRAYNLNKKFPCLHFEIYDDSFFKLIGRQIYPLSEKIQPIQIDRKAKWNFMKQHGASEHLATEKINFDVLLSNYNTYA